MIDVANPEVWCVTGGQRLYGPETLKKVQEHATTIAPALASLEIPVKVACLPVMTSSESIHELCQPAYI
jgi:L-arabinose isomerase